MKNILLVTLCISALSAQALGAETGTPIYLGLHLNVSESSLRTGGDYIDNGNRRSDLNPSFMLGVDYPIEDDEQKILAWLIGADLFFDYINKTVVQGDTLYVKSVPGTSLGITKHPRPMDNKAVYKVKFLAGGRLKLGFRFFQRVDLYGHLGLSHLGLKRYLNYEPRANVYRSSLVFGVGGALRLTEHWALSFDYKKARAGISDVHHDNQNNDYLYYYNSIRPGITILSAGLTYHF